MSKLVELKNSTVELYLTESRYFGCANKHADWDFFCKNNRDFKTKLLKLNYHEIYLASLINMKIYEDNNVLDLLKYQDPSIKIHVILVKYIEIAIKVRTLCNMTSGYCRLSKRDRNRICKEYTTLLLNGSSS